MRKLRDDGQSWSVSCDGECDRSFGSVPVVDDGRMPPEPPPGWRSIVTFDSDEKAPFEVRIADTEDYCPSCKKRLDDAWKELL